LRNPTRGEGTKSGGGRGRPQGYTLETDRKKIFETEKQKEQLKIDQRVVLSAH